MQGPMDHNPDFSRPWHFSDVVLSVEGTKFHVHRSILSMWSPVFEKMFTADFSEKDAKEIKLPGKKAEEIGVLLNIIYSCETAGVSEENYEFLLALAEEYQIARVKKLCIQYLSRNVNATNCEHIYAVAEEYDLYTVMESSLEESKYRTLRSFERADDFENLTHKAKVVFLKIRVQELEGTLSKYVTTCSSLVKRVYEMVAEEGKESVCDNYEAHSGWSRDARTFKPSCRCCVRRVQNSSCQIYYGTLREDLKTLFDLRKNNQTVQRLQEEQRKGKWGWRH
ncbi:PREDICTED: BTB and MATH domain-containing protein 38-like [Acropora digitifera]|uniref:BTB and MATH domain-containing protein 38-like n=1 Tax=Acropora digitifera TaxID=70779 RepID=UPI00077A921F|nr:PREDICTED: BTB and MATH domain-containing protein 38-like [Acropora digitifera]XP_015747509.1 PREDICTED: BTB and MATH domain-containing protein 38-like [Acropora digitifera]